MAEAPPAPQQRRHSRLALVAWLGVALLAHYLVALFGVMTRWLQVRPSPPLPALRCGLLVSLIALATVIACELCSALARWARGWHRRNKAALPLSARRVSPLPTPARQAGLRRASTSNAASAAAGGDGTVQEEGKAGSPVPAQAAEPEVPVARGLSRRLKLLEERRPRLTRLGALAVIVASAATAYLCQTIAPGFVDPALIQLVMSFAVIGVALFQRLLLHHALPLLIWPCSAVMLAGACMILVPTVNGGTGAGLHGWRGWLGFGLALLSTCATVVYFVALQGSRHMGFTSMQLQRYFLLASVLLLLPLALAVEGVPWHSQFTDWVAGDRIALVATGTVICVGTGVTIQHAAWQLGAPTVAVFFGLRLVLSILMSKALLSRTIISRPVQIAGTVLTCVSVTLYLAYQWRASTQQTAPAGKEHGAAGSSSASMCPSASAAAEQAQRGGSEDV